jgi:hypothetical protein
MNQHGSIFIILETLNFAFLCQTDHLLAQYFLLDERPNTRPIDRLLIILNRPIQLNLIRNVNFSEKSAGIHKTSHCYK